MEDEAWTKAILFEPGQYVEITPPGGDQSRAYSFASLPNHEGLVEFYVKLRPGGYFSTYLDAMAKVGDVLTFGLPQGEFTLRDSAGRARWMVCGGTGLAPVMSMLRRMAQFGLSEPVVLIMGVDRPEEIIAGVELNELRAALPELRTIQAVVQPDSGWNGPVGTAVDLLAAQFDVLGPDQPRPDLYLCGSPGFLQAAKDVAGARGVAPERVFAEMV